MWGGRGGAFEALAASGCADAEEEGAFFGGFGDVGSVAGSLAGAAGGASSWLWGKATETAEAVQSVASFSTMELALALAPNPDPDY